MARSYFARGGHARTLVRVDRGGRRPPLLDERRGFWMPSVSPDGRHVAVTIDPRPSQIWVYDLSRRSGARLATERHNIYPRWTSDGRRISRTGGVAGGFDIQRRAADGSSEAQLLLGGERTRYADTWSRDGKFLVFHDAHPTYRNDIWMKPAGGDPAPLVATPAHEYAASLSPDDRWLAYMSDESGRMEVYVRPFPNVGDGKWLISTGGGANPVWSPTGRELFYMSGNAMGCRGRGRRRAIQCVSARAILHRSLRDRVREFRHLSRRHVLRDGRGGSRREADANPGRDQLE
jgi:Tol biopolymer transport system component